VTEGVRTGEVVLDEIGSVEMLRIVVLLVLEVVECTELLCVFRDEIGLGSKELDGVEVMRIDDGVVELADKDGVFVPGAANMA